MSSILKQSVTALAAAAVIFAACQSDTKKKNDDTGPSGPGTSTGTTTNSGGSGGSSSSAGGNAGKETDCTNMLDDDNDTFIDCDDLDCKGTAACPYPVENTDALCSDNMDNDGDGDIDCADRSCRNHPNVTVCNELNGSDFATACSDNIDNDGNGFTDCEDRNCQKAAEANNTAGQTGLCWNDPNDTVETGDVECADTMDNEPPMGDGFVDCADFSCQDSVAACREDTPATCSDTVDNNNDMSVASYGNYVDCDGGSMGGDFTCLYAAACSTEESTDAACSDNMDNDGDGQIDCEDWSCHNVNITVCDGNAITCSDGLDNDGNGFTDCNDYHCCQPYAAPTCKQSQCPN